jgi:hypothetical protein
MEPLRLKDASGSWDYTFSIDENGQLEINSNEPGSLNGSPSFLLSLDGARQLQNWLNESIPREPSEWIIKGDYRNVHSVPQGGEAADVDCPICGRSLYVHPGRKAQCHCNIVWTFDSGSGAIGELPKSLYPSDISAKNRQSLSVLCKGGVRLFERR